MGIRKKTTKLGEKVRPKLASASALLVIGFPVSVLNVRVKESSAKETYNHPPKEASMDGH